MSDNPELQSNQEENEIAFSAPALTCAVVGIGASAGGLDALTHLFQNVPSNTGLGFVVIQHLDPHHESQLAGLLAMHTRMPVVQAEEGVTVEPNHVYVIPPNMGMAIRKCKLLLSARQGGRAHHLPIDDFFCSLAEDQKNRAVGVILSGSGSDGTIGLEAIKSEGGITFAQDGSAKFESMPRQAAATGVVDFVLPPHAIGMELANIARHLRDVLGKSDALVADGTSLQRIFAILRDRCGLDFSHYKMNTVRRRISRRMALRQAHTLDEYLEGLEQNGDEARALYDDLLITVTEFFRDAPAFQALEEKALPRILKNRTSDNPVRIWVPACSTGKEVYSMAITFIEYMRRTGNNNRIQIFGTDVSERAIETARSGKYLDIIGSAVSTERLQSFFTKIEGGYQVSRSVREVCVFSRHDLTRDPPLGKMDLVSCRNLLIYMGPVLQRRVMAVFTYALKPGGCLLLGNSETVGYGSEYFEVLDARQKLYQRNQEASTGLLELPLSAAPALGAPADAARLRHEDLTALDLAADRMLVDEYAPSGFLLNAQWQVVKFRGDTGPYLGTPRGNPTLDVLTLVREDVKSPLQSALEEVKVTGALARRDRIQAQRRDSMVEATLVVRPISDQGTEPYYLVLFEEPWQRKPQTGEPSVRAFGGAQSPEDLAFELASTRTYMQRLVEELRTANEEAQSSNEELQSTNEELQTAKEELQSSNEELTTTNEEMQSRNRELSQLNGDLSNLLSSLDMPIVMLDRDLRVHRYTPVPDSVFRLIPSDLGRPISDLRATINVPDLQQILREVIRSGSAYQREVQGEDNHWYSLRVRPYRTPDDHLEGAVLQLLDIDPLKKTLDEVEKARDYSGAVLATVREPLLVLDRDLRVLTANQSFYEVFRTEEAGLIGQSIYALSGGQWDAPRVHQMLDRLANGVEHMREVEIEQTVPGLGQRNIQLNARRFGGPSGEFRILLALDDITDRKRSAEAKYRRLFEAAKDGMLIANAEDGEITDINPFALDLFEAERGTAVGKPFWELKGLEKSGRQMLERLRTGEVVRIAETEIPGKREGCLIEVVANLYQENERPYVQLNIRDITERKRFERQLQQTAKLESLGVLAGGIAHDFNNLLTGIMGNASLALADAPDGSTYQDSLREVLKSSGRAADLTRQMLAYAGKGSFILRPMDLADLVKETSVLIRSSIPKTVTVESDFGSGLPLIEADSSQMQQLIMNLVINGAEAIGESRMGVVRIAVSSEYFDPASAGLTFASDEIKPGVFVTLEVNDTGSGMDEGVLSRIFDPFFTTKFTGRGLGLAAVQGIIRSHGGALAVESAPGQGTTFKAFIPAMAQLKPEPAKAVRPANLNGSGLVLVVDDDETVNAVAKTALEKHGYAVITAADGRAAVEIARKRGKKLDLVLLDLTMPVMGGEEAVGLLRKIRPDLRIILCSGFDTTRVMKRFEYSPVQAFLAKPYTAEELLSTVKQVMQ